MYLEAKRKNGELPRGLIKACAAFFPVAPRQVGRVFNEISKKVNHWKIDHDGDQYPDVLFQDGQRNNGGTIKHNRADVQAKVRATPLKDRMNLQVLSGYIDVPKATIHRIFKEGNLKRHSSALKPKLTDRNKNWNYDFARSKIDWSSEYDLRSGVKLVDFMDEVHVDKK